MLPPTLYSQDVHLWRVSLLAHDSAVADLPPVLSRDEHARAAKFRSAAQQREFVLTRSALRNIIAAYTGQRAADIHFHYGAHGKPQLEDGALQFNVSHDGGIALIAVARVEVGVDVERETADFFWDDVVSHVLSLAERQWISSFPRNEQSAAFLRCWTRREAYGKARGTGIILEPPANVTAGIEDDLVGDESGVWSLRSFRPLPDYLGACATKGQGRAHFYDWRPQDFCGASAVA